MNIIFNAANNLDDPMVSTGSSVSVLPETFDPLTGIDLSGWVGRVLEVCSDDSGEIALIQWDSYTLKNMPIDFIRSSLADDLNWAEFTLPLDALILTKPRDLQLETDWQREINNIDHVWRKSGNTGRRIIKVLQKNSDARAVEVLAVWEKYLISHLKFPIKARITYPEEMGELEDGFSCIVADIAGFDEKLGIYAWIEIDNRIFGLPIFDIEPLDVSYRSRQALEDYQIWWANR